MLREPVIPICLIIRIYLLRLCLKNALDLALQIYIDKRLDYKVNKNLNTYEHWEGHIIPVII